MTETLSIATPIMLRHPSMSTMVISTQRKTSSAVSGCAMSRRVMTKTATRQRPTLRSISFLMIRNVSQVRNSYV